MKGFLMKQQSKVNSGDQNLLNGVVGGIGDGLKFGAKFLKDTVGKAVPISNFEKQFFALKNGILYWYAHQRARKALGNIIVKDIQAIEINPKNKKQISLLYDGKLFKLDSLSN